MSSNRFHHEDDVTAAYEAAEFVVRRLVANETILLPDYRPGANKATVKRVAREIADAVIRSDVMADGDITDLGVTVERTG